MGLMADLGGGPSGWTRPSSSISSKSMPDFFRWLSAFLEKSVRAARSWLHRRLPCSKSWSFPTVLETICWPGDMKLFLRRVAVSTLQIFLVIICAPLHSLEPQRESRRLILSKLWLHWQPAARPFLRMIATFQPYPVSVSCNCLPTLSDPARWFRLPCCVLRAVSFPTRWPTRDVSYWGVLSSTCRSPIALEVVVNT